MVSATAGGQDARGGHTALHGWDHTHRNSSDQCYCVQDDGSGNRIRILRGLSYSYTAHILPTLHKILKGSRINVLLGVRNFVCGFERSAARIRLTLRQIIGWLPIINRRDCMRKRSCLNLCNPETRLRKALDCTAYRPGIEYEVMKCQRKHY